MFSKHDRNWTGLFRHHMIKWQYLVSIALHFVIIPIFLCFYVNGQHIVASSICFLLIALYTVYSLTPQSSDCEITIFMVTAMPNTPAARANCNGRQSSYCATLQHQTRSVHLQHHPCDVSSVPAVSLLHIYSTLKYPEYGSHAFHHSLCTFLMCWIVRAQRRWKMNVAQIFYLTQIVYIMTTISRSHNFCSSFSATAAATAATTKKKGETFPCGVWCVFIHVHPLNSFNSFFTAPTIWQSEWKIKQKLHQLQCTAVQVQPTPSHARFP